MELVGHYDFHAWDQGLRPPEWCYLAIEYQLGLVSTKPLPEDCRHQNYFLEPAFPSIEHCLFPSFHLDPSDFLYKLFSVFTPILRRHGLHNLQVS